MRCNILVVGFPLCYLGKAIILLHIIAIGPKGIRPQFIGKPLIQLVDGNKRLALRCTLSADPAPDASWSFAGKPLKSGGRYSVSSAKASALALDHLNSRLLTYESWLARSYPRT